MKKTATYFSIILMVPALLLMYAFSGNNTRYPGGSPAGYTGSPGDGKDCTQCHNGSSSYVDDWITADIPELGYTPGETYTITATVSGSGDKGFLISPQNDQGDFFGTLIAGSGSKIVGVNYITQTNGSSSNPKVWTFQWTAPEKGSGPVTFYGAFTVNKPVTKLSKTTVPERLYTDVQEEIFENVNIFPNPVESNLNIQNLPVDREITYQLFSLTGQKMAEVNSQIGGSSCQIDVSHLSSGIYMINLSSEGESTAYKFYKK